VARTNAPSVPKLTTTSFHNLLNGTDTDMDVINFFGVTIFQNIENIWYLSTTKTHEIYS
jgi:hypothetical protein